jgi:PAS domain S-box-containing protein
MTLRKSILLIISLTLVCLIGVLYLASQKIILRSFLTLEQSRGHEDVKEAVGFLNEELAQMDKLAHDYASWDDSYAFIARPGENQHYLKSNMVDETFINQKLNLILFVDTAGKVVYGKAFDFSGKKEIPVPTAILSHLGVHSPLLRFPTTTSSMTGILLLPDAPMLVAAHQILTSEDKGPARGTLIMGHYFDAAEENRHGELIREPIEARRADDPRLPADIRDAASLLTQRAPVFVRPLNADTLDGYTVKYDIYGKPAVYLKVRLPRDIYREGQDSISWFILALVGVGVVVGVTIVIFLQRHVLSRLTCLSTALAGIGESGNLSARVPVTGTDELADFAGTINRMLGALEKSQGELWESEVRYRSIVENTRDMIMLSRPDGTISYVSPSCRDLLGYAPEEMVNCRPEVWHPDDSAKAKRAFEEALKGGSGSTLDYRVVTKGGDVKWISHSWSPIMSDGKFRMIVSVVRDITEHRKMEEELIKAQKLETVGVLAGGIAHDFNNILTAVWGYLSLAKAAARPMGDVVELLTEAEKASVRARDLTQQLLTFSRGGTPVKRPLSLGAVLKDAAGFALSGSNVRCETAVPGNLWLVEADEGQVSQVINNLVLNAVQAMPRGGVIRISARNVRAGSVEGMPLPGRDYVMISVRDEGIGIPEEHLQKIFDPYFTTKQRWSGLGLSITYSIVRNHDGAITATSTLGEGTTFRVYLPAAETQAVPEICEADTPPGGTGRILFMDDDKVVQSVGRRMLEYLGYEVAIAGDGGEMLASYGKAMGDGKPFDAVIMDLTIPGLMGGREAIGKLLLLDPRARAIVSSGYSNDPVAANLAEHGFVGFVPKPYRVEELAAELRRVLSGNDAGGKPGEGAA